MFNAVFKIPMQFFILLLGVLIFVFYQFERPPVYFNQAAWNYQAAHGQAGGCAPSMRILRGPRRGEPAARGVARGPARRRRRGRGGARAAAAAAHERARRPGPRPGRSCDAAEARGPRRTTPTTSSSPSSSDHLPHGLIGLLVTAFFAAALSSKAGELNALGSTTTVDIYRHIVRREASDAHYVAASKWFTAFWGLVAIAFALFANLAENLIQAVNILGSIFYGVVARAVPRRLLPQARGRDGGVLGRAGGAGARVRAVFRLTDISYLWYNVIGCAACILFSLVILQAASARRRRGAVPAAP
jgi:SSS family solute:Na+ symporter